MALYKTNLAEKTKEGYRRICELVMPTLGTLELDAVSPDDVQAVLLAVAQQAGPRQAQITYAVLHAIFARATRSRHISYNPVDAVDKPIHNPRKARAITPEEWEVLRPMILQNPALSLMALAGLRRGEALAVQKRDIDLQSGIIHVHAQVLRVGGKLTIATPKSSAGIRDVPIVPDLQPVLAQACRYLHPAARLVSCAPETLRNRWQALQAAAGIAQPYRLHDLRHTYATRLVLAGCNLRVLQYVIGHASYTLTLSTYTHITPQDATREIAGLTLH